MSAVAWVAVGLVGGAAAGARFLLDYEVSERPNGPFRPASSPSTCLAPSVSDCLRAPVLTGRC